MNNKNGTTAVSFSDEEKEQSAAVLRADVLDFVLTNHSEDEIDAMSSLVGDVMRDGAARVLDNIKCTDSTLMWRIRRDQQFDSCQVSFVRDVLMRRLEAEKAASGEIPSSVTFSSSPALPTVRIPVNAMVRDPFFVG